MLHNVFYASIFSESDICCVLDLFYQITKFKNKMIIFISFLTLVESVCDPSSPTFGNCVDEALQAAGDRIVALESVNNLLIGKVSSLESKVTSLENENKAIKSELNDLKADIISLETFEEIFEEIDDTLKDLGSTNDIIKSDLTQLNLENVEQNSRIEAVEGFAEDNAEALDVTKLEMDTLKASNELLNNQYNVLDSKIKAVEGRLDILEGDAGTILPF